MRSLARVENVTNILTMEGEGGTILTMGRRVEGSQEVISADYFPFEQHRQIKVGIITIEGLICYFPP